MQRKRKLNKNLHPYTTLMIKKYSLLCFSLFLTLSGISQHLKQQKNNLEEKCRIERERLDSNGINQLLKANMKSGIPSDAYLKDSSDYSVLLISDTSSFFLRIKGDSIFILKNRIQHKTIFFEAKIKNEIAELANMNITLKLTCNKDFIVFDSPSPFQVLWLKKGLENKFIYYSRYSDPYFLSPDDKKLMSPYFNLTNYILQLKM